MAQQLVAVGETVTSMWGAQEGRSIGGVVSVLFTSDRRLFFGLDGGTIRMAADWERDEVLLQMLSWRDSAADRDQREVEEA